MGDDTTMTTDKDTARHCLVVDDDIVITRAVRGLLEQDGWNVTVLNDSREVMDRLRQHPPDCIIADIMMPYMDGLELCRRVREDPALHDIPFVVLSGKSYDFDRERAFAIGASGYIIKPVDHKSFAGAINEIVQDRITLTFWGVHGTLPVPGKDSVRYGGNTSCVSMAFSRGRSFIFDAGTGIKVLSDHLLHTTGGKVSSTLFISHSHWDHINALPFFVPLYIAGNAFQICGPAQGGLSVYDIVSAQMSDVYFPITIKEFAASVRFRDLSQDTYTIDGIEVSTMMLNHPGYCLGYRIRYNNRTVCYITDNELYPPDHPHHDASYLEHLTEFIRGSDALITDCTYFDDEYRNRIGWGHSSINEVAKLAHNARVKTLYLFHHDPDHGDEDIDRKLDTMNRLLNDLQSGTTCIAPAEKQSFGI